MDSRPQELLIEAPSTLVALHHRVKQPDLAWIEQEPYAEIFLIVEGCVKPHVGEKFGAFRQKATASAGSQASLKDLARVTESPEKRDVLEYGPTGREVFGDRRGGVRWKYLKDRHARETKERRGNYSAYSNR
jgi:hypothetical protein